MNTLMAFYYSDEETSSSIKGKESQPESLCASSITETEDAGTCKVCLVSSNGYEQSHKYMYDVLCPRISRETTLSDGVQPTHTVHSLTGYYEYV